MAKGAEGLTEVKWYADRDALLKELIPYIQPGDAVLVKASHFMGFPVIVDALKEAFEK
jgi:UDP-N-acetylmuramoyl-tripeptide--D-alanyl-D-alanine ligase